MQCEWFESTAAPANCRARGAERAIARRLAWLRIEPQPYLRARASDIARRHGASTGRVQGAGAWTDAGVAEALRTNLPRPLARSLRPTFEWYSCRGAHFHNDAHYGDVLFGAWYIAGPPMDIVFPRTGWRISVAAGDAIVFDPFEPHGVLLPGHRLYEAAHYGAVAPSVFLAFELELDAEVRSVFGIGDAVPGATVLSSDRAVNAENGALA
jgi:hypothetical protein